MPEDTLPIDRPTVVFSDEDAPSAMVPHPEPTTAAENGAAGVAAAMAAAATPSAEAAGEPAPGGDEALTEATAAAASVVSGPGGSAASAAVAAQGGGGGKAAGATFALSEDVGLAVATFERGRSRPANRHLLNLFVKDDHLLALWNEIGRIELEVVELRKASPKNVLEQIDRLTMARNLLLSDRDEYEDVLRQVNIVKSNVTRLRNSNTAQQPFTIQIFLYLLVAVSGWLFIAGPNIATVLGNRTDVVGIPTQVLWNSVLWGGIGGLSAAFYALVKHVEDYDPQHARWYYLSPMIGLFFGPLVALLADVGLPAFVQLVGNSAASNMEVRPAVMYVLAWAVGFKQNLLIQLINSVLARIVPGVKPDPEKP
jgi:hypothetical protein